MCVAASTYPIDLEPKPRVKRVKGMYATSSLGERPVPAAPYAKAVTVEFDAFYRTNRPILAKALALSLGDLDVATEATDEALTRAYERWSAVGRLDKPEAWVYRVASNWALSIFRRRRLSLHRLYEPEHLDAPGFGDPAVHAAVAALDVKHRSVVVCRHLLGWTVAETAVALGVSEGTVKSRLHRATATLRTQLREHNPSKDPS